MFNKLKMGFYHIYIYLFKHNVKFINLYWFNAVENFGDSVNLFLVNKLSSKKVVWVSPKYCLSDNYLCIGSVIHECSNNTIIWGSGFISDKIIKIKKPKKIYAVRGPRSRQLFVKKGIDCPEVYGDPALLLPRFYNPIIDKKYKIGVVLHYADKTMAHYDLFHNNDVKIIDIQQADPLNFIDDVLKCEVVISSSLHGLIVSDAYGIPSIWIKLSNNITGNDFKFYDYFESVKRMNEQPVEITDLSTIEDVLKFKKNYKIDIDLDKLIESCPFTKKK